MKAVLPQLLWRLSVLVITITAVGLLSFQRWSHLKEISSPPTVQAQGAACRISNNLAAPKGDVTEADNTLILLEKNPSDRQIETIVSAINSGENVIVRYGAGEESGSAEKALAQAEVYIQNLRKIRDATGNKPFIATATNNEPNCAEGYPGAFETEQAIAGKITSSGIPNITFITGQIDHLCGDFEARGDRSPADYISALASIPGISGVALPFYTADAGTSSEALALFNDAANAAGKPIYITESGAFKRSGEPSEEEFRDYIIGVQQVLQSDKVQKLLLFNALGINSDFQFTKPFHKAKCREAFREQCNDTEAVMEACFGEDDKDEYYLYPIKGINDLNKSALKSDLIEQGYEVRCTSPQIEIEGLVNSITPYLYERVDDNSDYVATAIDQKADFTTAQIPIWRNFDAIALDEKVSLEGWFGHRNTSGDSPLQNDINLAPLYRLLSLEDQCEYQKKILEATQNMCNKLEDPSTCALDTEIENSDFTTLDLWNTVKGQSCESIIKLPVGDPVKKALNNVPLFMPKAYRLAFLVMSAELQGPNEGQGTFPFNFLRMTPLERTFEPQHEVRVFTFKIPDIGLNRDPSSDIYYEDPLEITRNAILTIEDQKRLAQEYDKHKRLAPGKNPINCKDPANSEYCADNPLVEGLVETVNERLLDPVGDCELNPDEIKTEVVSEIFSPAVLEETGGRKHKLPSPGDIVESLKSKLIGQTAPLGEDPNNPPITKPWPFSFLSEADADPPGAGKTKIRSYLIFPQGYQLQTVEETLAGFLYTVDDKADFYERFEDPEDEEHNEHFKLEETGYALDKNEIQTVSVKHWQRPPCTIDPETGEEDCPTETISNGISAKETDREPRVFGGILGKVVRNLQLSIRQFGTQIWHGVNNCKTTEQFLLGKCGSTLFHFNPTAEDINRISQEDQDQAGDGEGEYCIDWELANADFDVSALQANIRSYLTSLPYSFSQPTANQYQRERYEELQGLTFTKFDGTTIPPDVINQYENFYGGGRALLWTKDPQCGGQNCFDFIIDYCTRAGYNPALCVAMNLSESGGSNHIRFGGSYDFGCLAATPNSIPSGLDCITGRFFDNQSGKDYNAMFQRYAEHGFDSPSYQKIRQYYTSLSGGLGINDGPCQ